MKRLLRGAQAPQTPSETLYKTVAFNVRYR